MAADRGGASEAGGLPGDRRVGRRRPDRRSRRSCSVSICSSPATPVRCILRSRSARRWSPIFGPSDPARYAPRGPHDRVVRVDLPCSPCNRIRLPPARCVGHTPDCLSFLPATRSSTRRSARWPPRARCAASTPGAHDARQRHAARRRRQPPRRARDLSERRAARRPRPDRANAWIKGLRHAARRSGTAAPPLHPP